jgi:excisionase family DNA binding protein
MGNRMKKRSGNNLLTPAEASEMLFGKVSDQTIRKLVRDGKLPSHQKPGLAGRIYVKWGEVEALYAERLYGWVNAKGKR